MFKNLENSKTHGDIKFVRIIRLCSNLLESPVGHCLLFGFRLNLTL